MNTLRDLWEHCLDFIGILLFVLAVLVAVALSPFGVAIWFLYSIPAFTLLTKDERRLLSQYRHLRRENENSGMLNDCECEQLERRILFPEYSNAITRWVFSDHERRKQGTKENWEAIQTACKTAGISEWKIRQFG